MKEMNSLEVSSTIRDAFLFFARCKRGKNLNKFGGNTTHPEYVACLLARFVEDEELIAAAILQDILTCDCSSIEDITKLFGDRVADLVCDLTITFNDDNVINRRLQLAKYFNTVSSDAFTIKLASRLHTVLSLIDPIIPEDFAKWQLEDTSYILNNINRELDEPQEKMLDMIEFAMFYVELTRNI